MEFNYFKTSVMSAMAVGALAFSASTMAAAPVSVDPAQGYVESLESVSLTFADGDVVAWTVNDTPLAPRVLDANGDTFTMASPFGNSLVAEGNVLTYNLGREVAAAGEYKVVFPAGSYSVNGEAGEACEYTYTVNASATGYTVSPDTDVVSEIRAVVVTFAYAKKVTALTEADGLNSSDAPRLYLVNEDGTEEPRDMMVPSANGNNLVLNTWSAAVTAPGTYVLKVPGACYFVDGKPGEDLSFTYTIAEDPYPAVTVVADPEEGEVDVIDTVKVTFDGVEGVKWTVDGNTALAPYIADMTGARFGTFFNISEEGNTLSMTINGGFSQKGVYQVILPEGSYAFTGEVEIPGKRVALDYDVVGLTGYTVEPEATVLTELENFRITFHDAKEVTLPSDLGTGKSAYIELVTEDGVHETRATLFSSVVGNALLLKTYGAPIYEPGEYVVVVPGNTYLLDGVEGSDISLNYTVVEPSYPEVEISANPATDTVETIDTIEVTFGGVDIVEWAVTGTENAPYIVDLDGNRWGTFSNLNGNGNMLSMTYNGEFTAKGEFNVVIPEGSYKLQGKYHGMPGKEVVLKYEVLGLSGITLEPANNIVSEIQYVTVTFNEANEVTLADNIDTNNSPILYLITEDGVRERRGTMFPSVSGNKMNLRMNSPIYDEGEYVIVLPGSVYFLDGNEGKDEEFYYTVVTPSYPDVELSVNPATDTVETIDTIEVTFGGVDIVEWAVTGTENTPYIEDLEGNRCGSFYKLGGLGNMLSMTYDGEFTAKGEYKVIIPEGAYKFQGIYHGMPGEKIELKYEVLGLSGITVEPAAEIVTEIQYVDVTFNEATEVTLAENLGTDNTPYLYIINEEGQREGRGAMFPSVSGNKMNLRMNTPIYDKGEYVIVIPGTVYFLDGNAGEDVEINYTVVAPSYPEVELSVNPATDTVETIDTIEVTFEGVDIVEWAVTGTENAPYIVDLDGNRWGTFSNLSGNGNMLSMTYNGEFTVKGEYEVVIPDSAYVFQGKYHGLPGNEIRLKYEVLGLSGIEVDPSNNIVTEIQNVTITFNEAKEVTLAENLGTDNTPYLYFINEEGNREARGAMFPSVSGNKMNLRMNSPIYDEGEYVIVVPGTCYFLDGNEGKDEEIYYTVVEPSYPEVELSVNPATDTVETIDTIEITFEGVDVVEWNVSGTEDAPYVEDLEGNRWATFYNLGGQGNVLTLTLNGEFAVKGEYKVVIPEGAYVFQGIYRGMPGHAIELKYEVLGLSGMTVEPAHNMVSEIQNVTITFNEASAVTLSDELSTLNTPYLYLVTEDGERERRGAMFPSVSGNKMNLRMNAPITEEGEYVIVVPGSCYFLDGNEGETFELGYIILPNDNLDYTVEPKEGSVSELHTIAITFPGNGEVVDGNLVLPTALWNPYATEVPSITCDGEAINGVELNNLYANKNVLYAAINTVEVLKTNGYYLVTIPGTSYIVDGKDGVDIILAYNLDASGVKAIFGENVNVDVYDINGRVVVRNADAEAIKALRGVYVIGGKKFILR